MLCYRVLICITGILYINVPACDTDYRIIQLHCVAILYYRGIILCYTVLLYYTSIFHQHRTSMRY